MTEDEFKNCTKQFLNQLWNAQTNYKYFWGFNEQFSENAVDLLVTNYMRELWHETRQAFFTAMIFELTRLYDKNPDTLSIAKWINAGHHLHQSSIARADVDKDLTTVTKNDSLVNKLLKRRNKGLFHVDLDLIKVGKNYDEIWPIEIGHCKQLLERAFDLHNKYHNLFFSGPGGERLGAAEACPPTGDIQTAFIWLKKEFDATKEQREAFERKRVNTHCQPKEASV